MADPQQPASPDNQSFKDQRDILREINAELGKQINNVKDASKAYSGLEGIARKLQNDEEEISKLSVKQLKDLKAKAQANLRDLKTAAERLKYEDLSTEAGRALFMAKEEQFKVEQELLNNIQQRLDKEIKINKQLGLTGSLLKGMSKIPIVGNMIDAEKALGKARDAAGEGAGKLGAMGAALGSIGKDIAMAFVDPLAIIGLVIKGLMWLIELGFKVNTQITQIGKSMVISDESARRVRNNMMDIATESKKFNDSLYAGFNTLENLLQAQTELAEVFGATRGFTDEQLRDQIYLTKQIGLSTDEAAGLQQLAMANKMTADEVVMATIKQTSALTKQTGIQLDNKKVLAEVAKVSGQIRLQYQNNPELIAKAVVQTQKLGVSLEQAAKQANHLLNFEESIEDQIAAELLTGKELNLERARLLALNGDIAGASEEILRQVGSAAEFSQMNVIQQRALAKAAGMSADELANSLVYQENLNKLGSSNKKQIEETVAELKRQGRVEEANRLMAETGNEAEAKAALERVDAQTKFNELIEKVKSTIANLVGGEMEVLVKRIVDWLTNAKNIETLIQNIKEGFHTIKHVAEVVYNVMRNMYHIGQKLWPILRVTAAIGTLGLSEMAGAYLTSGNEEKTPKTPGASNVQQIQDAIISNRGLIVAKTDKGSIQPIAQGLPEDNVVFTSNKPQANAQAGPSSVSINMEDVIKEQQHTNTLLRQLLVKEGGVYIDTTKSGTATTMGTYQIQ